MTKQQGTHHGCQGQCHKTRHQHSTCQRQRKLAEQLTCSTGRECQGRKHCCQSHGHRHNGKANFFGPFDGSREWIEALFDVPINVLQHHNRIVHHQANGQNQGQQCQGIDGEACQSHHGKGANQTDGNGDDGNDGGAEGSKEYKDNQGHQNNRFQNSFEYALDGLVNED